MRTDSVLYLNCGGLRFIVKRVQFKHDLGTLFWKFSIFDLTFC